MLLLLLDFTILQTTLTTTELYVTKMYKIRSLSSVNRQADAVLFWNNVDIGNNITHIVKKCGVTVGLQQNACLHCWWDILDLRQNDCCSVCETETPGYHVCEKLSEMDLPSQIVRRAPMSRPLLVRELDGIIARWERDPVVVNLFDDDKKKTFFPKAKVQHIK
jgi:hypothetical protein